MKIIRVFPRLTHATPTDELAYVGYPSMFTYGVEADKVHISVAFTWDLPEAERLEKAWRRFAPVEIGGPATGQKGEDFVPGMYLKKGYVITSRGCDNQCWFCSVPQREGTIRKLPITDGWNVLDDNLLACSKGHIQAVFTMLARQERRSLFTGGLEAAKLKPWHVEELVKLNPVELFFAYDTPNDREPLYEAGKMLMAAGFKTCHPLRAYVLVGYPGDTFEAAKGRLYDCINAGFTPMAMLYRDGAHNPDPDWIKFTWPWARPAIIYSKIKNENKFRVKNELAFN